MVLHLKLGAKLQTSMLNELSWATKVHALVRHGIREDAHIEFGSKAGKLEQKLFWLEAQLLQAISSGGKSWVNL